MNDPWTPQPSSTVTLLPAPIDPLRQIISSDQYLDSLEKKLGRLKGRNVREPTPQDIVKSLSKFRDDQMKHFLKGDNFTSNGTANGSEVSASYIQRRLYPEKQPLSEEELVVLIKDDELAKKIEEQQDIEELSAAFVKEKENIAEKSIDDEKPEAMSSSDAPETEMEREVVTVTVKIDDQNETLPNS